MSKSSGRRAFGIADDLTLSPEAFRAVSASAAADATPGDRAFVDFIAAFGSDAAELRDNGKASGKIADTAFRTMSGAGHQHFLGFMRTLAEDVGPDRSGLATVGFSISKAAGAAWTWPVWSGRCTAETICSLLALSELQQASPPRTTLARMGVCEVFRCHRIRQGKYRNLTPAQAV